ncbi:MAG TPA: exonuclease domain-containing protein [Patescibacteria group bacterium]|nr:exonuclease domain-containing protein [Patescibacteria group bacterium]
MSPLVALREAPFVVFDTETTYFDGVNRLVEIGAVRITWGKIESHFTQLVNPGCPLSKETARLTGITQSMLQKKPTPTEVIAQFLAFAKDAVYVAHNAPFDAAVLRGVDTWKDHEAQNGSLIIDTLRLSRRLYPSFPRHGLDQLMHLFGIMVTPRHRALPDALATARLFHLFLTNLTDQYNVKNIEELVGFMTRPKRQVS